MIFNRATGYLAQVINDSGDEKLIEKSERELLALLDKSKKGEFARYLFGCYRQTALSDAAFDRLYKIWDNPSGFTRVQLNQRDLISMSYDLAIKYPEKWSLIRDKQRSRITNPDQLREFDYIFSSTSPDQAVCDSVFAALMLPENRIVEPWTLSSLSNLNHRLRQEASLKYIRPALEKLEEIQRTGDIFFPQNWCSSLLRGHNSKDASEIVKKFIDDNTEKMNPMLLRKVLQRGDHLL